jgi:hypothetical protein
MKQALIDTSTSMQPYQITTNQEAMTLLTGYMTSMDTSTIGTSSICTIGITTGIHSTYNW